MMTHNDDGLRVRGSFGGFRFKAAVWIASAALVCSEPVEAAGEDRSPRQVLEELSSQVRKTRVLILGTPHLRVLDGRWRPEPLESLLELLAEFRPDAVAVEQMPPSVLESLEKLGGNHLEVARTMARETLRIGGEAREVLGLSRLEAEIRTGRIACALEETDDVSSRAKLRRRLVLHLLAAYDEPSALLHWAYLPESERRAEDGLTPSMVERLGARLAGPNETVTIAVALARRLGLKRLLSIDDHQEAAETLNFWPRFSEEIQASPFFDEMRKSSFYEEANRRFEENYEKGDLLDHYLWLNSPAYTEPDVLHQWGIYFRTRLASGLDRARLAMWEARNLRMTAHIRQASAAYPGGSILVVVGAAHKPFLDHYLGEASDLEAVALRDLLK